MKTISFDSFKKSLLRDIQSSRSLEDIECALDGNLAIVRGCTEPCQWTSSEVEDLLIKANGEIQRGEGLIHEEMEHFLMDF